MPAKSRVLPPLTIRQQHLVRKFMPLAMHVVNKCTVSVAQYADHDDADGVAYLGLCRAAVTFNPKYGVKFITYAFHCIRNQINEGVRVNYRVNTIDAVALGTDTITKLRATHWPLTSREPDVEERAEQQDEIGPLLAKLTPREREVVHAFARTGDLAAAGRLVGGRHGAAITRERVRQIIVQAQLKATGRRHSLVKARNA